MNNKITSYGLVGVSILLALGLFLRHSTATEAQKVATEREEKLLGALKVLEAQGTALRREADLVTERLKVKAAEATAFSNKVEILTPELTQVRQSLVQATAAIETVKATVVAAQNETRAVESRAAAERAQLEKALAEFQRAVKDRAAALTNAGQANEQLARQAEQLTAELTRQQTAGKELSTQAAAKEQQLVNLRAERDARNASDNLLAAKCQELERQLHDRQFLQEQIAHLKSTPAAAARTAPVRDDLKGTARLNETARPSATESATKTVTPKPSGVTVMELRRDGTVALVPVTPPARR